LEYKEESFEKTAVVEVVVDTLTGKNAVSDD